MKKLLNTAMLACALFLTFISCSKENEPIPTVISAQPPPPILSTGPTVTSNNIDLDFTAYSSLPPTTLYTITVNGTKLDEFSISQTAKRKWQLNLQTGLNTVNLHSSPVSNYVPKIYSSFFFNIDDHVSIQNVAGTDAQIQNFSFNIIVIN